MVTVTAKELHIRTADILHSIQNGEDVLVTFRGVPRARITPVKSKVKKSKKTLPAIGMWKDRPDLSDPSAYVTSIRESRFPTL